MFRLLKRAGLIVLLAGTAPLFTTASCQQAADGGHFVLSSTNEDLVDDVLDELEDIFEDD